MFSSQVPDISISVTDDNEAEIMIDVPDMTIFSAVHFPYGHNIFNRHSAATFCNVRRYRNRSSAQLVTKRVLLGFWKLLQQLIDLHHKFSRLFPSVKFLELELKFSHNLQSKTAKLRNNVIINAILLQIFTPYPIPLSP